MRYLIPLIIIVVLYGCQRQQYGAKLNTGYGVTVSHVVGMRDGIAGLTDVARQRIYLGGQLNGWTLAHEAAHYADLTGLQYASVVAMIGDVPALPRQVRIMHEVAALARTIRAPNAHWIALSKICGRAAVGHPEILKDIP